MTLNRRSTSWLCPSPTGDPGRDRNARTLQFACLLWVSVVAIVALLDVIGRDLRSLPLLGLAAAGQFAAALINRAGRPAWAARTAILVLLLTAILLVFEARDGFRSHAMLVFPGLLLVSVMLMDRRSYVITGGVVLLAVTGLGIAERHGLTAAIPRYRSPTTSESIIYVNLLLLVFALIGSRIARDAQKNVSDLRAGIDRLSSANRELVQIKEDLEESEQRLSSAQRLSHVGSWHWNLAVNQVVCSAECKRIFGQPDGWAPTFDELLDLVVSRERKRVATEIQRSITEKSECSTEFQIVRPDGDLRTVTFTSQVLVDEEGSPRNIVGACQDVTQARRMHEEALARQKLETVGTLANGIAHDFNNLLGGVLTQAELALSELAGGSRPEEELKSICNVAKSGSEIVRQLMMYTGQELEAPGLVNVAQTAEEMAELLKLSISKRVTLHTDLVKDVAMVRANAAQIRQILMNLVMNASEAIGDREGTIHLAVRRAVVGQGWPGRVQDKLAADDLLQLEVADTGAGITPETQARIFDPFFTTKPLGHGLGLAVVSGIVRGLGGSIHVVSEPGKGATFQILLPCERGGAKTSPGPTSPTQSARENHRPTILVVEDEDTLRKAAAKMLHKSGLSVIEAADGSAAMTAIRTHGPIDVLLLDVTLPGTPSHEVLAEAKRLRPATRVIVTSAYAQDFAAASLQDNVERFIRKPYSLKDLLGLIHQTLMASAEPAGPAFGNESKPRGSGARW